MTSVTKITKEKTAKIIPNAIAVSTDSEKHIFTSFISRDQTYNLMITAWRKALTRDNIHDLVRQSLLGIKSHVFATPYDNFIWFSGQTKPENAEPD